MARTTRNADDQTAARSTPGLRVSSDEAFDRDDLVFRRGFVIGHTTGNVPPVFCRVDFPLPVWVHPAAEWATASHEGFSVFVTGAVVHPEIPAMTIADIAELLCKAGQDGLQDVADRLVGRHVLLFGRSSTGFKLQTDSMGLRMVFFGRNTAGAYACSHPGLAEAAFGNLRKTDPPAFYLGWAGIATAYEGLYRLPPNLNLDISSANLERFFPIKPIPQKTIEEAWATAISTAHGAMQAFARRGPLLISLTAGLDSRTTLAALGPDLWHKCTFFTYHSGAAITGTDVEIAQVISDRLGLDLTTFVINHVPVDRRIVTIVQKNSVGRHGHFLAAAYHTLFSQKNVLHLRTNLLELGRSNLFYKAGRRFKDGVNTPETMAEYYRRLIAQTGVGPMEVYVDMFRESYEVCSLARAFEFASSWDLFFVEHRMGAWMGNVPLESDVAFETAIAFNSRNVIASIMGVPEAIRATSNYLTDEILRKIPGIEDVPLNPKPS